MHRSTNRHWWTPGGPITGPKVVAVVRIALAMGLDIGRTERRWFYGARLLPWRLPLEGVIRLQIGGGWPLITHQNIEL